MRAVARTAPVTRGPTRRLLAAAYDAATAPVGAETPESQAAAVREARAAAQERVRRGGFTYASLMALSTFMKLDVILFGRFRSGPFFALLRKSRTGA